jgi:hypothetical protein
MRTLYTLALLFIGQMMFAQTMVTFSVDLNDYTGEFTTVEVNGSFNGWCGVCNPMTETSAGSGIYETTIDLPAGDIEYKFTVNATQAGLEYYETLVEGDPCTVSAFGFTNRFLSIGTTDIVLDTVCFESCSSCDDVVPNYSVTFKVDMNDYTGTFSNMYLNGNFNGWCGACALMTDDNSDGVYEITITLAEGQYEYKFTANDYFETLEAGTFCTLTTDQFTNRVIDLSGDTVLDAVCFESCNACGVTGLDDLATEQYSVFPNPSNGLVQLSSETLYDVQTIRVYSHTGQIVRTIAFNSMENSMLDLQDLPSGVYHLEIQSATGMGVENIMIMK